MNRKIIYTLCLLSFGLTVQAAQHALVVGIDQYPHANKYGGPSDLEGAVNDALLLRNALRRAGVQLPDKRVLLNDRATRATFIRAWRNLLKQAQPGDTLILTFSGHGIQQELDTPPLDEKDAQDEALIFYDFNSKKPNQGYIRDDEFYGLFEAAKEYKILFLVDACHSGGMVRSIKQTTGRVRQAGVWNLSQAFPPLPTQSDNAKELAHVTHITAVKDDHITLSETAFEGKKHGALSWFFAKALNGEADGNQNGHLERSELDRFLREKVSDKMNNLQEPKLQPSADMQPVITLSSAFSRQTTPNLVAIVVENARMPRGLKHVRKVNSSQSFDLRFVVKNRRRTQVFNNTGDKITTLPTDKLQHWQRIIDKERLLKILETQFDMRLKPIRITLHEGDGLHKKGEKLHFNIDTKERLNALTLFNLAGNGELQFLYPLTDYKDPLTISQFPYTPPSLTVKPPFGGDDLVAVLCNKPAKGLHTLLAKTQPNLPTPAQIIEKLRKNRCQVGQYAFFSSE
jgi:hypothetical protein